MDKSYFVMLNLMDGGITPMLGDADQVALYGSFYQAEDAAEENILGQAHGYEIFERGNGE